MFLSLKLDLINWDILSINGDDDIVNNVDQIDLIDRLSTFLYEKKTKGELKGGFIFTVLEEDYRGIYSIKESVCDIVLISRNVEFEDPEGDLIDSLTGLEGKYSLLSYIDSLMNEDRKFQLFLFGIDNFRNVTDVFGVKSADYIVKEMVNRILYNVVSNYTMYRYDADTFALVREGRHEEKFIKNINDLFDEPFTTEGKNIYITISIGSLNVLDMFEMTSEMVVDRASIALNHAKSDGKNTWVVYNEKLKDQSLMELEMETMIRDALKTDQFELYYQPQFSLSENKILGAEALIRWNHPERGFISPGIFIPVAEKNGLVVQIGEWVVKEVCRQQRDWLDRGLNPLRVGVNIGSLHFKKPTFVEDIKENLDTYGIPSDLLGLEITEGSVIYDENDMIDKLNRLRDMGIKVSIDDFGTGYSSLSYLKKFPIDTLKIDQSFILNISSDTDNKAIVTAIISLAKHMNLKVIAEGVETEAARDILRGLDCHDMQGYLFSKPVSGIEFEKLMKSDLNKG